MHKIANRILCYQLNCFPLQGKKQKIDLRRLFAFLVDVDECQSPDACHSDHVCNNTVGSYTCECPLGFAVDSGPQNPVNPVCVGKAVILPILRFLSEIDEETSFAVCRAICRHFGQMTLFPIISCYFPSFFYHLEIVCLDS